LQVQSWRLLVEACFFLPRREQLGVPSFQLLVRRDFLIPQRELFLSGGYLLIPARE
jgi:hypothetical protein